MNILHLRASNFVGGPEKQILEHFRYIDKERYHLFLGIFGEKNCPSELAQEAKKHGIDCIELNSKLPFSPFLIFQLSNEIKRQNIDILCTHGYKPNIIGYWACKLVPCIHIAFSRGFTAENFKVKVYEWLDKIILRRVKNVIAVSDGHAKELIHFGING
ncbi:MAG: glycosyltransferase, partial [Candidatus Hermodarchaeota archaeon]